MDNQFHKFLIIGLTTLAVIIIVQNAYVVNLSILFWKVSVSQIILLPLLILLGFVIGYFVGKRSW
jgi:uncharacterized integral membrane protein